MARGARHRTLDTFLHRLRARAATALLRLFPARKERRLGKTTDGAAASTAHRQVRTACRKRMAAQAHTMDKILSRPVSDDADDQKAVRSRATKIFGNERWFDFPNSTARKRDGDHRTVGFEAVCLFLDLRCRFLHRAAR